MNRRHPHADCGDGQASVGGGKEGANCLAPAFLTRPPLGRSVGPTQDADRNGQVFGLTDLYQCRAWAQEKPLVGRVTIRGSDCVNWCSSSRSSLEECPPRCQSWTRRSSRRGHLRPARFGTAQL
jgi:hypothetical protein